MAATAVDVPAVVDEAFRAVAADAGFKKPRFHIESGSNAGDGYTSVIYRAVVTDQDPSGADQLRLIGKTTATDIGAAGFMMQFIYAAEATIYSDVIPALEDIAKLKAPLPWPKCYYSQTEGGRPCLVVGDKCPERFRMADRRVPLDEHHLRHALYQLARFHGASMAMELQRPDQFNALAEQLSAPYHREDVKDMWRMFLKPSDAPDMLLDRFPAGGEVHSKLVHFFNTFGETFFEEKMVPGKEVGNSIIHGDCHVNNMLFQYDEAGAVTGCVLIDFQTTRYSTTALDLTTLLLSCTEKALRDAHWDALLRHYHTVLQDTLRDAGVKDPDTVYSWEQFKRRLGDVSGYGLLMCPMLLHALNADAKEVAELKESVDGILNDNDEEAKAGGFVVKWTPDIKRRVGDLVEDMVRWGWL